MNKGIPDKYRGCCCESSTCEGRKPGVDRPVDSTLPGGHFTLVLLVGMVTWVVYIQITTRQMGNLQAEVNKKLKDAFDVLENTECGRLLQDMVLEPYPIRQKRSGNTESVVAGEVLNPREIQHERSGKKHKKDKKPDNSRENEILRTVNEQLSQAKNDLTKASKGASSFHPSIHLVPVEIDKTKPASALRWEPFPDHSTTANGENTGLDHFFKYNAFEQTVKIPRSHGGRYHVYAQITYNGRPEHNGSRIKEPGCAYSVMVVNADSERGILYGATTQNKLGLAKNRKRLPHDAVFTSGVFTLAAGDTLRIAHSPGTSCNVRTERDKTFFGMFLLSEVV